jgi:hypothetical protein
MFWLKTECLSVEQELCEFLDLVLQESKSIALCLKLDRCATVYVFIYLYLTRLPDTFFLKIIYFLDGKETDLTALLEITITTEHKKWCCYETNTALCRAPPPFFFFFMSHIL